MVIIFISALEDCVFQAFDVGALHYLVKPFYDDKLAEVLARAAKQLEDGRRQEEKRTPGEKKTLMITRGGEYRGEKSFQRNGRCRSRYCGGSGRRRNRHRKCRSPQGDRCPKSRHRKRRLRRAASCIA